MRSPLAQRVFDVAVAGAMLVVGAPLIAVASAAIKLESPRDPVLFSQVRVGRCRQPFRLLKLRTMTHRTSGPEITTGGDPRITKVGRWLRATKLDELPQLWNVLRGELSLVGPRPEVPRYVELYRPEWNKVFDVRPGLTDPASITFRDEASLLATARDAEQAYREVIMPMKLELALDGVERGSLTDDIAVMIRTLRAVLRMPDARAEQVLAAARRRIESLEAP